jgi:hypothetical protein
MEYVRPATTEDTPSIADLMTEVYAESRHVLVMIDDRRLTTLRSASPTHGEWRVWAR